MGPLGKETRGRYGAAGGNVPTWTTRRGTVSRRGSRGWQDPSRDRMGTIRKTPKVLLVYLVKDCGHSLLNNLVLQRRDPERPLPAIRFWDEYSSRWLRSISAAVNPAVQIDKPTVQPSLILLPSDPVHSWRGLTLQRVKAIPEQCDCQMVKQGGELHLLPFPCCPAYTRQPLGHADLTLCRVRAGLMSVLLDQRPSLLTLRLRFPLLFE